MRSFAIVVLSCVLTLQAWGQTAPVTTEVQAAAPPQPDAVTPEAAPAAAPLAGRAAPAWRNTKAPQVDDRTPFLASVYLGEVIDTFAADEVLRYLNPEDANTQKLRTIGGVDFEYRLTGGPERDANGNLTGRMTDRQLWVYGQTIHGVRSRDVDCKKPNNAELSVCKENIDAGQVPTGANDFIAILRNAGTLEAFVGFRYEFPPPLQTDSDSPARLFVKGQFGFLSVSGGGGDVVDDHNMSVGAIAVGGRFEGSFLQVGFGRNDLFLRKANQRYVIDAFLSVDPQYVPGLRNVDRLRPFVEFTGNFDAGGGADSIQTWFGLDFQFRDPAGR